jgi:hypothetical protein
MQFKTLLLSAIIGSSTFFVTPEVLSAKPNLWPGETKPVNAHISGKSAEELRRERDERRALRKKKRLERRLQKNGN